MSVSAASMCLATDGILADSTAIATDGHFCTFGVGISGYMRTELYSPGIHLSMSEAPQVDYELYSPAIAGEFYEPSIDLELHHPAMHQGAVATHFIQMTLRPPFIVMDIKSPEIMLELVK